MRIRISWDGTAPIKVVAKLHRREVASTVEIEYTWLEEFKQSKDDPYLWHVHFLMNNTLKCRDFIDKMYCKVIGFPYIDFPKIAIVPIFKAVSEEGRIYFIERPIYKVLNIRWVRSPWFTLYSKYNSINITPETGWFNYYTISTIISEEKRLDLNITLSNSESFSIVQMFVPSIKKKSLFTLLIPVYINVTFNSRNSDLDLVIMKDPSLLYHPDGIIYFSRSEVFSILCNGILWKALKRTMQYADENNIKDSMSIYLGALSYLQDVLSSNIRIKVNFSIKPYIIKYGDFRSWKIKLIYRVSLDYNKQYTIDRYKVYMSDFLVDYFSTNYDMKEIESILGGSVDKLISVFVAKIALEVLKEIAKGVTNIKVKAKLIKLMSVKEDVDLTIVLYSYVLGNGQIEVIIEPGEDPMKRLWDNIPIELTKLQGSFNGRIKAGIKILYKEIYYVKKIPKYYSRKYYETGWDGTLKASFKTTIPYVSSVVLLYSGYEKREDIYAGLNGFSIHGYGSLYYPTHLITILCYGEIRGTGDPYQETNETKQVMLTRYYVDEEYDQLTWDNIDGRAGFLFENIFPYTRITVSDIGSGDILLIYLYDDPEKELPYSYSLKVLLYNRTENQWYNETVIPSREEAVMLPQAIKINDEEVLFVWMTVPYSIISNSTRESLLENLLENSIVKVGVYNVKNHQWEDTWNLTDEDYIVTYRLIRDEQNNIYLLLIRVVSGTNDTLINAIELYNVYTREKVWSIQTYNVTDIIDLDSKHKMIVLKRIDNSVLVLSYNNELLFIEIPKPKNATIISVSLSNEGYIVVLYKIYRDDGSLMNMITVYRVVEDKLIVLDNINISLLLSRNTYIYKVKDQFFILIPSIDYIKLVLVDSNGNYSILKTWNTSNILDVYVTCIDYIINIFVLNMVRGNITHPITGLYYIQAKLLPERPRGPSIVEVTDSVYITWDQPLDWGDLEPQGYIVYRDGEPIAYLPPNQTWYNDTEVDLGRPHVYEIIAFNEAGKSDPLTVIVKGKVSLIPDKELYQVYKDEYLVLRIRLVSINGTPLPNHSVSLYLYNGSRWVLFSENTTDNNGYTWFTIKYHGIPIVKFKAVFNGSDQYLSQESNEITIKWIKKPVRLNIDLLVNRIVVNSTLTFNVRVSDIDGKPLSNIRIYLYNGTRILGVTTTDQNGIGKFNLFLNTSGIYNLTIKYNGSEYYDEVINYTVLIVQHEIKLYFIMVNYKVLDNGTILFIFKALLLINGKPFPNQTIFFYKKGSWIYIGSNITDPSGVAMLYYLDNNIRDYYIFRVNYTSTNILIPSTYDLIELKLVLNNTSDKAVIANQQIEDNRLSPLPEPPIYLLLLLIILLIIYLVRRREKLIHLFF
ncbi:MAG: hypothetical protein B6U89_04305 [Desulfurococcales archaeon ex4484_58]|nr:MAG: hypothetical protein B6U89_04305 [Desulfurococcales archaeon ex4484_58]